MTQNQVIEQIKKSDITKVDHREVLSEDNTYLFRWINRFDRVPYCLD